ncbi:hypothetical protein F7725_016282 [Dissostichus mawsoni]|uniref:UBC core domain-containing protein n=1 Tax=Dissostichus mawsoni TaxID=36200 RepID=A0A7J5Z3B9_DISMA|nr:hypothetical protein F7725_016282 [Dissostichus mawsoni]
MVRGSDMVGAGLHSMPSCLSLMETLKRSSSSDSSEIRSVMAFSRLNRGAGVSEFESSARNKPIRNTDNRLPGKHTEKTPGPQTLKTRLQQELMTLMVYEGLRYRLSLEFPAGYPYQAPRVKFLTSCFHPNVDPQGFICLDILKDKWSALYDVRCILLSLQSLLGEPNNESPLNTTAAELWENQEAFKAHLHSTFQG